MLELLADGVPGSKRAIGAELGNQHPKDEVLWVLMWRAVAGWRRRAASKSLHWRERRKA